MVVSPSRSRSSSLGIRLFGACSCSSTSAPVQLAPLALAPAEDFSFTLRSQIIMVPESNGLVFDSQFGETHRASSEADSVGKRRLPGDVRIPSGYGVYHCRTA